MVLELCLATQLCVWSEYNRGLRTQPRGTPVLTMMVLKWQVPDLTTRHLPVKVQHPVPEWHVNPWIFELCGQFSGGHWCWRPSCSQQTTISNSSPCWPHGTGRCTEYVRWCSQETCLYRRKLVWIKVSWKEGAVFNNALKALHGKRCEYYKAKVIQAHGFVVLGMGTITDFLKQVGTTDWAKESLNMDVNSPSSWLAHDLRMRPKIPPGPGDFMRFTRLRAWRTSCSKREFQTLLFWAVLMLAQLSWLSSKLMLALNHGWNVVRSSAREEWTHAIGLPLSPLWSCSLWLFIYFEGAFM